MKSPERLIEQSLPVRYVGADDVIVTHATHFVLQFDGSDFLLTMGQVEPPIVIGEEDEIKAQLGQIEYAPAKVLARVVLSVQRVRDLRDLMNRQLERIDKNLEDAHGNDR